MNVRERIQQLGKELLTLAGLQNDIEERVVSTKKELEKLQDEIEVVENEHS